jgi:hypothetical protein
MSSADTSTYVAEKLGADWAVWRKRPGTFPRVVSKHRTESAARKAVTRFSSVSSSKEFKS